jgi:hypothetical protein
VSIKTSALHSGVQDKAQKTYLTHKVVLAACGVVNCRVNAHAEEVLVVLCVDVGHDQRACSQRREAVWLVYVQGTLNLSVQPSSVELNWVTRCFEAKGSSSSGWFMLNVN